MVKSGKAKPSQSSKPPANKLSKAKKKQIYSEASPPKPDSNEPTLADEQISSQAKFPSENPDPLGPESDVRFSNIVKASPMGILLWQLESDRRLVLVGTNPAANRILGVDCTQFIGQAIEQAFPPLAQTKLPEIYRTVAATGTPWHSEEFAYEDPLIKGIYEVHAFQTAPGQVAAMFNDISDRKEIEASLQAKEADHALILRSVPLVLYSARASGDFAITWTSGRAYEITGIDAYKFIEESDFWASRLHPDDRDRAIQAFKRLPETGSCTMEYRWQHADGSYLWFLDQAVLVRDSKAQPKEIIGTWIDVTDRKQAEELLEESEARYRDLYDNAPDMFVSVDAKTAKIIHCNQIFVEALGYTKEEIIGQPVLDMYHPDSREDVKRAFESFVTIGKVHGAELQLKRKDGTKIEISLNVTAVRDEQGNILQSRSVCRDITERKQAEEEISKLAKFPSENPNPVLRISSKGAILYCNQASQPLLNAWQHQQGHPIPSRWNKLVTDALDSGHSCVTEVECDDQIFSLTFAPVIGSDYVNVYALDITDRKQVEQALRNAKDELEVRVRQRTADLAQTVEELETEVRDRIQAEKKLQDEQRRLYSVLQMLPGYVILHGPDHKIRFANDRFLELFGEPGSRPCYNIMRRQDHPCDICQVASVLAAQTPKEWEWTCPEGKTYHVWGYPFTDVDQTQVMLELGIDITERKNLETEVLRISENERQRIGQDLHDSLSQTLSGISCLSQVLHNKLAAKSMPEAQDVARIESLITESIKLTQSLARGLTPVGVEAEGLMSALRDLASNVENMFNIHCVFQCDQPVLIEDKLVATHTYRIAQEAINNAVRHGQAQNVIISLTLSNADVVLSVEDDGRGLPENITKNAGMGLRIMNYRARTIGATLSVQSRSQGGTSVVCQLKQTPPTEGQR